MRGLPALDAVEYVQGDNWLGVALAALMCIPPDRVAWLGLEALRRLQQAPLTDQQRFLLGECVQAYLPLNAEQQREFGQLLATEPYRGLQAVNTTWYEKGRDEGRSDERRAVLRDQLEENFGPLATETEQRLLQLSADRLAVLTRAIIRAQSLRELGLKD